MGVVKNKTKNDAKKKKEKQVPNGKPKDEKVKKKKTVSCLQCIKPVKDGGLEGKYRVAAPELMQDTFMSDSEDEGGEVECPIQQQQQYRYMNSEAGTLHRAKPLEDSVTDGHLWPSNNDRKVATIERQPVDIGFLVSFVVDARGGAMKAKRRGGVRVIVPPAACAAPTRVTCRAATRRAPAAAPPPLMEGEALASRLLELQPQGAKFLQPVIIEVPIFTSSSPEREVVILRSDTGDTWQDHYLHNNDNPMIQEALQRERLEYGTTGETLGENGERVTRIITCDFPHYLACVSRVRQEVHIIGPEGGTVSSAHIPQVQALFPPAALTKRIRVGLQAHGASAPLSRRVLPRHAAVSPVVTVEPRRRKFHRTITLTVPLPAHPNGGPEKPPTSNLRLLCSIMGGQARAVWEDVTGSTPLTIAGDCASFTTTVSARFWLMNCQNVSDATKLATELYRDMLVVPFEARIVVLGKRLDSLEGRLLVMYITDRYAYETLLQQEHYTEVAHSTAVRFLDGREVYLEFSGNLVPVTKSGSQPMFTFEAFKDNRVEFTVRVKHHEESPSGRVYFMNEPKVAKGEQSQTPACVLDVELPQRIAPRAGKSQLDCLNLDQSGFDALHDELSHWGEHNASLGPALPHLHQNGHDKVITNGGAKYPAKDIDTDVKDTKPQVNGNTVHVDSNKTKATFDSDEDKTPMNTLEKGKKHGGFLGGLADKVKNAFSLDDEEKEASPKPQPKLRDSKEKSPPKPAPRIINEDILDKVEDMFKDLHSKPHIDDDLESQVYSTKLVVDEDAPSDLKEAIPCCKGDFNQGRRHKHEHVEVHEKVSVGEGLDKLAKEKDNIKQKSSDVGEDLFLQIEEAKSDIKKKGDEAKSGAHDRADDVSKKLEDAKAAAKDVVDHITDSLGTANERLTTKAMTVDFLAMERAQDLKTRAHEIPSNVQQKTQEVGNNIKNKAQDTTNAVVDSIHSAQESLNHKAQNAKKDAKEAVDNAKETVNEKIKDISEGSSEKTKKAKKEAKKKAKEGKNFFTGLVHNIFGEKEKIENEVKNKIAEGKESANELAEKVASKKDEIKEDISKKENELKQGADKLVLNVQDKAQELEQVAKNKKDEVEKSVSEAKKAAEDKAYEVKKAAEDKANESKKAVEDKANEIKKAVEVKANEAKKAAEDKVNDTKKAAEDKAEEVKSAVKETVSEVQGAINDRANEVKDAYSEAKNSVNSKANEINDSVHDKANEIKDKAYEVKDTAIEKTNEVQDAVNIKSSEIKNSIEDNVSEIKNKTIDIKDAAVQKVSDAEDAIHDKASEIKGKALEVKDAAIDKTAEVKNAVQSKAHEVGETVQHKSADVKDAAISKAHEIQDAVQSNAEEISDAANQKASEVKDKASAVKGTIEDETSKAKESVANKAGEIKDAINEKSSQVKDKAYDLKDSAISKAGEISDVVHAKVSETKQAIHDKTGEITQAVHDTTSAVVGAVQIKADDIEQAVHDKKDEAQKLAESELDRIKQQAQHTTEQISRTAEDTINAATDKKNQVQMGIADAYDETQKAASEGWDGLQRSSKQVFGSAQDSALNTFDNVESSVRDRAGDLEDLQSSARDTYAELRDDTQNSAQDTLRSFQSSAGNTFDSLDDSAREIFGGLQAADDSFEGFQVSADNKLEDVKGEARARLQAAGEGLEGGVASAVGVVNEEADNFTSSLNNLGSSVFGSSGKGFMKDSSAKLLESERSQSQASPSPQKKSSGIPKLKKKKK